MGEQPELTKAFLERAIDNKAWDLGNDALYQLCSKHRSHKDTSEVIAKVWLIGRSYAAAIERRQNSDLDGDRFYIERVAPIIIGSQIDEWISRAESCLEGDAEIVASVHYMVMKLFSEIAGEDRRSLASKYLHFHVPARFYLFDSRAENVAGYFCRGASLPERRNLRDDRKYHEFIIRAKHLRGRIEEIVGRKITVREFDKCMLAYANAYGQLRIRPLRFL